MKALSKSIGIFVVTGALLLGGISFPHETNAKPKCLVKGSVNVKQVSKTFKFEAKQSFTPKLDLTYYGDAKGSGDATLLKNGSLGEGGYASFNYSTKKQTKTFVLKNKKLGKSKNYELYFTNGGNKTLHITSFCLHS